MERWPPLRYDDWADTAQTLHMWMQVIGKVRLEKSPFINHYWHVPLYVTAAGLGTSPIPDGARAFEVELDFVDHRLRMWTSAGEEHEFKLEPMTVADFYTRVMKGLREMGVETRIYTTPSEVADPIPFEKDTVHRSYDASAVNRFWRALLGATQVFAEFRSEFIGKVSPIHFFWGAPDLAVTRFSGRTAPPHPGAPGLPISVAQECYSHEVCSAGFWAGGNGFDAAFYSYGYPEPPGYADAHVEPAQAYYSKDLREFLLPYEAVRTSKDPEKALMAFLKSTYDAAANLGNWDRAALERK